MKKLTKIFPTVLAAALLASMAVPCMAASYTSEAPSGNLPAGTLIYYEDFDGLNTNGTDETLQAIGWSKSEGFKEFTAILSTVDGKLHIDNLDATVGTSNDSYAWVLSNEYCEELVKQPYTYQYEATLLDAENDYRYLSVLLNYDGMNNYNTVDIRMRGIGYNQYREGDSWVHYDEMISGMGSDSVVALLYGIDPEEGVYAMQNKTFKVRVEVVPDVGCTVYVNDVRFSEMTQNEDHWSDQCAYGNAIAFKTSTKLLSEFDNFMIWTGTGVEPDLSVLNSETEIPDSEPTAEEVPGDSSSAEIPETGDIGIVASAGVLALAAYGIIKTKKHR